MKTWFLFKPFENVFSIHFIWKARSSANYLKKSFSLISVNQFVLVRSSLLFCISFDSFDKIVIFSIILNNSFLIQFIWKFASFLTKFSISSHNVIENSTVFVSVGSYWLAKEWIANCCLPNLGGKSTPLYRNSPPTISSTDPPSHDPPRSPWGPRSSVATGLFSPDQAVSELCCHSGLISSRPHTHLPAHWPLGDPENQ